MMLPLLLISFSPGVALWLKEDGLLLIMLTLLIMLCLLDYMPGERDCLTKEASKFNLLVLDIVKLILKIALLFN